MIKKQESRELFPIQQDVLDADFRRLGDYNADDIEHLKTLWLDASLAGNPTHELLTLAARPEVGDDAMIRRPYRAGILVGTVIMRHRLNAIGKPYTSVDPLWPLEKVPLPIIRPGLQLSRFALSQFFSSDVDITSHLRSTLEADWLRSHNSFQPQQSIDAPHNDWLSVGMGDTLALYGMLYAIRTGRKAPRYHMKPLVPEPRIGLIPSSEPQ